MNCVGKDLWIVASTTKHEVTGVAENASNASCVVAVIYNPILSTFQRIVALANGADTPLRCKHSVSLLKRYSVAVLEVTLAVLRRVSVSPSFSRGRGALFALVFR